MDFKDFLEDLAIELDMEPDELGPETELGEEVWDSLAIVSTISLIDEQFDITLEGEDLASCEKVSDLLALIEKEKGA